MKKLMGISAVALSAVLAQAADPTTAELMEQIKSLQGKVQQLEAKASDAPSRAEVDATIARVLQDADKRTSMAVEGITAGWDKEFFIGSADGNFRFIPILQLQIRNTTNYVADDYKNGDDNLQNGWEIRRAKIGMRGNAFTKDLEFFMLWGTVNGTGTLNLEQAFVKYWFAQNWGFRIGQFTTPVFIEQQTSSRYQLAGDRSLANQLITGTNEAYIQSAEALYRNGSFSASLGFTDGIASVNTTFEDPLINNADFGVNGRLDYQVFGSAKDLRDFTSRGTKENTLGVGGGFEFTEGINQNLWMHTADVRYENANGWNLQAIYLGNFIDSFDGDTSYNAAGIVQAGYLFRPDWEVFGRADATHFDNETTFSTGETRDWFYEFSVGVNWYAYGNNAKMTIDLNYLPNGAPADAKALGILGTPEDEIFIRGQFQLAL